jgi:hypothetical protein
MLPAAPPGMPMLPAEPPSPALAAAPPDACEPQPQARTSSELANFRANVNFWADPCKKDMVRTKQGAGGAQACRILRTSSVREGNAFEVRGSIAERALQEVMQAIGAAAWNSSAFRRGSADRRSRLRTQDGSL